MNKKDYLKQAEVAQFVEFMTKVINGSEPINFSYRFHQSRAPADFDQLFGLSGTATTLEDLFDRYWWNQQYYQPNSGSLQAAQTSLRASLTGDTPSVTQVREGIEAVMKWGLSPSAAAANMRWAEAQGHQLPALLLEGKNSLEAEEPDFTVFQRVRMNAGYTKVFSLLCDGRIIYDGRVGAALGWLVRRFLVSINYKHPVPETLAFRWASGRSPQIRNPSGNGFNFETLGYPNGDQTWARMNVHASWILEAARLQSNAAWCADSEGLRKIEAALFMLGYGFPAETIPQPLADRNVQEAAEIVSTIPPNFIPFIHAQGHFDVNELEAWIQSLGTGYVVIGGSNQTLVNHEKPHSLDYWLRLRSNNPNVRQSTQALTAQLVATGLFTLEQRPCAYTRRSCNSLILTRPVNP